MASQRGRVHVEAFSVCSEDQVFARAPAIARMPRRTDVNPKSLCKREMNLMCAHAASRKSKPHHDHAPEYSVFTRAGSEFECLRGFRSTDTLFAEPIQSFTTRLVADDWCSNVRRSKAVRSSRHNLREGEANSAVL